MIAREVLLWFDISCDMIGVQEIFYIRSCFLAFVASNIYSFSEWG
jgi:hypothetical protein